MAGTDAADGSIQSFDAGSASADGDARQALGDDGVVCLRGAFEASWLSIVEDGIVAALAGESIDLEVVKREGDKGQFSFSSGAWQTVEPFQRFKIGRASCRERV